MSTMSMEMALMPVDPAAVAAAESVKARIQASYLIAIRKPRSEDQARAKILESCRRPEFAERVEYAKPVGGKKIKGPSIRFAETAIREWGNILSETQLVYEDERIRRTKITMIDLETNATFSKEIQISKTVERRNAGDRVVVGERTNTSGDKVFIVQATDDELSNKEAALISKAIRNEGLRLLPSDIVDEAMDIARQTLSNRDAKDPKAAKKRILDSFMGLGISPREIEKYIGHAIDTVSPSELHELRGIYQAIKSGEATWRDYVSQPAERPEPGADGSGDTGGGQSPQDQLQSVIPNNYLGAEINRDLVQAFVKLTAEAQGRDVDEVYLQAAKYHDRFLQAFIKYQESQTTKDTENGNGKKEGTPKAEPSAEKPISFTPEYKALQAFKEQDPDGYKKTVSRIGLKPVTVENCLAIIASMKEAKERQTAEQEQPQDDPQY